MTNPEIIVAIIQNDSTQRPERPGYIIKEGFNPNEREAGLLEDSDFLFLTKEHPENMPKRLRATPREMAQLWRKAGDIHRFHVFNNLTKATNSSSTKQKEK